MPPKAPIRLLLASAFLLAVPALALAPVGQRIDFRVTSETRLAKSFKHGMRLDLSSMGMSLNGEQIPPAMLGDFSIDIEEDLHALMIDEYLEVDGDQPVRIRRTYETLENGGRRSANTPQGEQGDDHERDSPLAGRTVLFSRQGDSWSRAFEGDGPNDPELLGKLEAELDFTDLLPAGEVRIGDQWELDVTLFDQVINPGGELSFVVDEGIGDEGEMMGRLLEENLKGEFIATYAGVRRTSDRELAVIELACDLWTEGEESARDADGKPRQMTMTVAFDLEGQLLWDLGAGHFHTLEMRGELGMVVAIIGSFRNESGKNVTMRQTLDFDGELDLYAEVIEQ